ncbi:MAG TPA: PilZ domain-containing protein [Candidatus Methanoperedens sp.]|nr:PilZ domain-containing protein [Candidatus Methanoperedens sp.]
MELRPGEVPVRRYPRMVAEYAVSYRRELPGGRESNPRYSQTRTLGLGGLMFETDEAIERGEALRVEIALGDHTIAATGTVVYTERRDGGPWQIGVQFTALAEDDRDALLGIYLQREYRLPPE